MITHAQVTANNNREATLGGISLDNNTAQENSRLVVGSECPALKDELDDAVQ